MKYNKVDALLRLKGFNLTNYAEFMGVARQQVANKKKTDSFRADELIQLAELTGTTLAFVNDQGEVVMKFDKSDIAAK